MIFLKLEILWNAGGRMVTEIERIICRSKFDDTERRWRYHISNFGTMKIHHYGVSVNKHNNSGFDSLTVFIHKKQWREQWNCNIVGLTKCPRFYCWKEICTVNVIRVRARRAVWMKDTKRLSHAECKSLNTARSRAWTTLAATKSLSMFFWLLNDDW